MSQLVARGLFILLTVAVAGIYATRIFGQRSATEFLLAIGIPLSISFVIVIIDALTPRKKLSAVSGLFLGLIVGMIAAYALSFIVDFIKTMFPNIPPDVVEFVKVMIGIICVFISATLVLQTKDDFRFVIPYVEFSKQFRGNRPLLLDTSAIIDGRVLDIADTHLLTGQLVVPRFVIAELQTLADSQDKLKRAKGRRGLDMVAKLQAHRRITVSIAEADVEGAAVDQKLVAMAKRQQARIMTTDFNLTKVAEVGGVEVINLNTLAAALRPVVLPGEAMNVRIIKPGEGPTQGVGYLDDGTMIVVEQARDRIGEEVTLTVTSILQTNAGRMIFGRAQRDDPPAPATGRRPEPSEPTRQT